MNYQDKQPVEIVRDILQVIEELSDLKDIDAILDRVLLEARRMTCADAGSIFLVEDDQLKFSYVHNDVLFSREDVNSHVYTSFSVPINENSIVGYVAMTGEMLVIDDAYALDANLPYSFNRSFDDESGYRTHSILTIPLKTLSGNVVGVMQLINATDINGETCVFTPNDLSYAPLFANNASVAIERGIMTRETMLRMMKMAEMRDPSETGAHVLRVGSYSAEIYHKWAIKNNICELERNRNKDIYRLAAMLHDVGKVGISDVILKKPGRLTSEEYDVMRWHTVYGAALFVNSASPLDELCADIALNHHERWDGTGYPGHLPDDLNQVDEIMIRPKKGTEISLAARICALADVYDALGTPRVYKDAWPEDKILDHVRQERGKHFDPEIVDCFFEIYDVIRAIREKYKDKK